MRLELNFTFALEHVTEVIVLGERMSSVAVDKFGVVGEKYKMDNVALRQIIDRIPRLKYRYIGSYPCDLVPTLPNNTFAIVNTQPSQMEGEHWTMIAKFHNQLFFADSLAPQNYSFLGKHYQQLIPQPLQVHPSVGGLYTLYAALHLLKFGQKETTGVHDVNVLSFISIFM